ncbi:glycosyltransferase [Gordonibacter pamelaeae]|uniref:glycosyltransferase n=1 Tax=Gordonibacter pamelaeae TaxID=471189 RepID=UPI00242FC36B|nr:glycosyltransferase [Gordonibacter pamelaeae]
MKLKNRDIIFVSNALANGGAARVICELASEFSARGKRVGVAVYNRYEACEYAVAKGVQKEYGPQGAGAAAKARRLAWLRGVAKRNPGACIVAFEYFVNMQTIIACAGLGNRLVVSERNDPARVGGGRGNDWLRERLYRRAAMLVCQTDDAAAHFSAKVAKTVILNPVKEGLPEPFGGERRHTVVSFCRLEKQKNLSMLLRAFSKFHRERSGWTLEVYGDGSERESLDALASELGLIGKVSLNRGRSDVHEAVLDAGMFVLSSDYEGLSNSMLEAMAIGLPTICTDCPCGGARMVIRDGENGLLVPVGGERELATAMTRVADEPGLAARLGAAAASVRERLSVMQIAGQWEEVIRG